MPVLPGTDHDTSLEQARALLCEHGAVMVKAIAAGGGRGVRPVTREADLAGAAIVRRFGAMFVADARLTVPVCAVVLRKAYGLGAMAMTAGDLRRPAITVAWPTGEFGGMGLEGAVRLGYRKELDAIEDPEARRARYQQLVAQQYTRGQALSTAAAFEIDDVIDPAETRAVLTEVLARVTADGLTLPSRLRASARSGWHRSRERNQGSFGIRISVSAEPKRGADLSLVTGPAGAKHNRAGHAGTFITSANSVIAEVAAGPRWKPRPDPPSANEWLAACHGSVRLMPG